MVSIDIELGGLDNVAQDTVQAEDCGITGAPKYICAAAGDHEMGCNGSYSTVKKVTEDCTDRRPGGCE